MWEMTEALWARSRQLQRDGWDGYCLFCLTGKECKLAAELNERYPAALVLPFLRMVHKSENGRRFDEQEVLLKGYVFAYLPSGTDVEQLRARSNSFHVLDRNTERETTGALCGEDRIYAEWVLKSGGCLGVSRAIRLDGKVKIIDGPLLRMEGRIKEVSKKNRNCRVQLEIVGKTVNVWLPFEWVEDAEESKDARPEGV